MRSQTRSGRTQDKLATCFKAQPALIVEEASTHQIHVTLGRRKN